jgi:hypothetical protein
VHAKGGGDSCGQAATTAGATQSQFFTRGDPTTEEEGSHVGGWLGSQPPKIEHELLPSEPKILNEKSTTKSLDRANAIPPSQRWPLCLPLLDVIPPPGAPSS